MATTYTNSPSTAVPGQVVGRPIRLPAVLVCGSGQVHCGWAVIANTRRDLPEKMAAKRKHEESCQGGLIVVTR